VTVCVRVVDPEVALIVMVYVPAGVPVVGGCGLTCAPLPPQADGTAAKIRAVTNIATALRHRPAPGNASGRTKEANMIFTRAWFQAVVRAVVLTRRVDVAIPLPGFTEAGLKLHAAAGGTPAVQDNDTEPVNPGWPFNTIAKFAA
jgi:hypothetical protein